MLIPLLIGCATVFITMTIQIAAVVRILKYLFRIVARTKDGISGSKNTTYVISSIMVMLFVAHLFQVAVWAVLFMQVGEFSDFQTAFYHSMVNFASLGYGDIVMSEHWRILGSIEACAGVLMFGVSAGAMLSIMSFILTQDVRLKAFATELKKAKYE